MPTTNFERTATESTAQQGFRRVKTQPISVERCQGTNHPSECRAKESPTTVPSRCTQKPQRADVCKAKLTQSTYQASAKIDASLLEDTDQKGHLAEFKPTCGRQYKMLSFFIPCVAVAMMFTCEHDCALTAIVSGLLAGCSGSIIYATIKHIRHSK